MNRSATLTILILVHAVLLISPVMYLLGFRALLVIPLSVVAVLILMLLQLRRAPVWILLLVSGSLMTSCLAGTYWESWQVALYPAYFGVSILAVGIASNEERRLAVKVGSLIVVAMLVGAWISFLVALAGYGAVAHFTSATGRALAVYILTFTPVEIGNFIRPAGIYDEPGALAMVLCILAYLRHTMGMGRPLTWAMLLMGFVTFSIAHLIYVTIHFLSERKVVVAWTNLVIVALIASLALSYSGLGQYFEARLLGRLSLSSQSDRLVRGDNRTKKMLHAYQAVSDGGIEVAMVGIDSGCVVSASSCIDEHPLMGENPITPIAHLGLLVAWPYYLFLIIVCTLGVLRRSSWPLFGVGLLFMQRPSLFSPGYSMLASMILLSVGSLPYIEMDRFRLFRKYRMSEHNLDIADHASSDLLSAVKHE